MRDACQVTGKKDKNPEQIQTKENQSKPWSSSQKKE
jgi:hypothetical protein